MVVKEFFQKASKLNVLVIGDVMIDRYLTGHVDRVSPEAPVPVVAQLKNEDRLGGAANVALNIHALGANPILCGVVGQDVDSANFFSLLQKVQLTDAGVLVSEERTTTVKTRIIAGKQHLLRLDRENTHNLSESEFLRFCGKLKNQFDQIQIDAVILQDYNKGVLSPAVIDWVLELTKRRNIPVAVDPKFENFWRFKGVDLFKPNLREVQGALKKNVSLTASSLSEAVSKINQKLNNLSTLITLSEHGVFWDKNGKSDLLATRPRKVADVCGAGDAVISIAAIGLALNLAIDEIALLSNLVGGQVVERLGVVPVDQVQLEKELLHDILQK